MSYEAIFFEKSDLQKFEMFRTLTVHHSDGLSISDLAAKLSLSYQQSYNIFQELLRDLVDLTDDTRAVCKKALNGTTPLKISLDDYRTYLLQDAIAFQFIDYLVQGNRPSLDRFCAERYISRSTLMRKTIPVRNFLAEFHLKLSLTKTAFVGDEKQVRLFLQQFYWLSYHGTEWPFQAISYRQLRAQYRELPSADPDPIVAAQERVFWAICRTRLLHGHYIKLDASFARIFTHYPFPTINFYQEKAFPGLTKHILTEENAFFYFFQQKTIRFTPPSADMKPAVAFIKQADSPIWPLVKNLLAMLQTNLRDPEDPVLKNDEILQMNLLRMTAAFALMGGNYVKQPDLFPPDAITYQQTQLQTELAKFIADLPNEPAYQPYKQSAEPFMRVLFYLLVPYLRRFKWDNTVKVKLVMETTDIVYRNIINFLQNLNVVELLPDNAPLTKADLLVTSLDDFIDRDQLTSDAGKMAIFNWYLDATTSDYRALFEQIAALYRAKLTRQATLA